MQNSEFPSRHGRLTEPPDRLPIAPFRKAEELTVCELYWLPASVPATEGQRRWTLQFLAKFVERVASESKVKPELFVEWDAIYPDRHDAFVQTAIDSNPLIGFSRAPGGAIPSIPDNDSIEAIRKQEKPFAVKPFVKGVCYWFVKKDFQKQMDLFWGFGGMTVLLVKPDPAAKLPEVVIPPGVKKSPAFQSMTQQNEIPGMLEMAASFRSAFLKKSKEYFGKGWEERAEYRGLLYVLPKWSSQNFFALEGEEVAQLFDVCEIYIAESPLDSGVLLASGKPIRPILHEIVQELQDAGVVFPG